MGMNVGGGEGYSPLLSLFTVENIDRNSPTMPPVTTATIRHLLFGGFGKKKKI